MEASLAERRGKSAISLTGAAAAATSLPIEPPAEEQSGSRTPNLWKRRLGRVVRGQRAFLTTLMRVRMARRTKLPGSSAPVLEVATAEAAAQVPIWAQGDEELYTEEALQARSSCRQHKDVLAVLHVWWQTAQRSLQSGGDVSASTLDQERYVRMLQKVYKTMIEEYDEAEARECAEDDWERDRQGCEAMDRGHFCDALFELADMWTSSCEPQEYVRFLWKLLKHVTVKVDGTDYLWKDDSDICFDAAYADWDGSAMLPSPSPTPGRNLSRAARRASPAKTPPPVAKSGRWSRWPPPSDEGSTIPAQLDSEIPEAPSPAAPALLRRASSLKRIQEQLAGYRILRAARAAIRWRRANRADADGPPRTAPAQLGSSALGNDSSTMAAAAAAAAAEERPHTAGIDASASRLSACSKPGTVQTSTRPTVFSSRLARQPLGRASAASLPAARAAWMGRQPAPHGVLTGQGRPTVAISRIKTPPPATRGAPPSSCVVVDLGQQLGLPGGGAMRLNASTSVCPSSLSGSMPGRALSTSASPSPSSSLHLIRNPSLLKPSRPGRLPPLRGASSRPAMPMAPKPAHPQAQPSAGPRLAGTLDRL